MQKFGLRVGVINLTSSDRDKSLEIQTNGNSLPSVGEATHRVSFGYCAHRRWCIFSAILAMALVPAGLLIYMLYLWITFGNPLIFRVEEAAIWQRYTTFPWVGIIDTLKAIIGFSPHAYSWEAADFTFTLVPLVTLIAGWKRLPLHYSLFSAAMVLFVLCEPCQYDGLLSVPRYLLALFPIILIFALWSKQKRLTWQLMIPFILFFVLNVIQFASGNWVA